MPAYIHSFRFGLISHRLEDYTQLYIYIYTTYIRHIYSIVFVGNINQHITCYNWGSFLWGFHHQYACGLQEGFQEKIYRKPLVFVNLKYRGVVNYSLVVANPSFWGIPHFPVYKRMTQTHSMVVYVISIRWKPA